MPGLKDAGMMMYRGEGPLEAPQAVAEPPPPRRPTLKRSPALQDPAPAAASGLDSWRAEGSPSRLGTPWGRPGVLAACCGKCLK